MSRNTLKILDSSGHLELTWNPDNPTEVAEARAEVARLRSLGYQFFLVDDGPADEIAAGHGKLSVRRVDDPTELPKEYGVQEPANGNPAPEPRKGRQTVATRPMRGG